MTCTSCTHCKTHGDPATHEEAKAGEIFCGHPDVFAYIKEHTEEALLALMATTPITKANVIGAVYSDAPINNIGCFWPISFHHNAVSSCNGYSAV